MSIKRVVKATTPVQQVAANETILAKLYGVQHKNFGKKKGMHKRYKLHQRPDGTIEAISFTNCTAHLNEANGFTSLETAFAYCESKGHTMYEFDTVADFATWLAS